MLPGLAFMSLHWAQRLQRGMFSGDTCYSASQLLQWLPRADRRGQAAFMQMGCTVSADYGDSSSAAETNDHMLVHHQNAGQSFRRSVYSLPGPPPQEV